MPTYSFKCPKCDKVEEKYIYIGDLDKFDSKIKKDSPKCKCTGRNVTMKRFIDGSYYIIMKKKTLGDLVNNAPVRSREWFTQQSKKDNKDG